jgi:UDP-N-acetylmuramoylalanine--D-glutamate ligase
MQNPRTPNKHVIVGLGKTGMSCVRYLAAHHIDFAVTDQAENPPCLAELRSHFPQVPLFLGKIDADLCAQAEQLIVSPGIAHTEPAIAKAIAAGIPIVGDIELFARTAIAPIVAITGSNGKSTVTTLVGEMALKAGLDARVGGNLGTPALDLLSAKEPDLYVLELSSFQLETTYSLQAQAAVVLNLCQDHMDRYADIQDYLAAKQRIYQHCDTAVVNTEDPLTWNCLSPETHRIVRFGMDKPEGSHFGIDQGWLMQGETRLIETRSLHIKGRHQYTNALAALALGEAVGLPMPAMLAALQDFQGIPHRCQWVTQYKGVDWYNDSKATNVGAAEAALTGLGTEITGRLVVIAGGQGKNADFRPLRASLEKYARYLILLGQDAPRMATELAGSVSIERVQTLEEAVELAAQQAQAGDVVVLAPACASLDMFKNFEHRGEVFMEAVKKIAK